LPDVDSAYAEWSRLVVAHVVSGKKTHDARLVAAMTVQGLAHILTFNVGDFSGYLGLTVLDPSKI